MIFLVIWEGHVVWNEYWHSLRTVFVYLYIGMEIFYRYLQKWYVIRTWKDKLILDEQSLIITCRCEVLYMFLIFHQQNRAVVIWISICTINYVNALEMNTSTRVSCSSVIWKSRSIQSAVKKSSSPRKMNTTISLSIETEKERYEKRKEVERSIDES